MVIIFLSLLPLLLFAVDDCLKHEYQYVGWAAYLAAFIYLIFIVLYLF